MIHLHNHSYYSLLDGHSSIKDIVSKAKDLGMPAVALTDHGVMYGSLEFYKECVKQEIKPIIGCEVYVSPTSMMDKTPRTGKTNDKIHHHLILIAKNNKGYENLSKIVSIGFTEGFYYDPRVDKDVLRKYSEGLICTSACLGGVLPQELLKDTQETYGGEIDHKVMASNYEDAKSVAIEYQEIFGKENYFIELMDHGLAEQKAVNPYLVKIADDIGATIIATNDAHYVDSEDFEAYQTLLRINTGASNEDEVALGITENELYFKTEEEMRESLPVEFHQAIENTHIIADMCDVEIKYGDNREVKLPYFELPTPFINALKASIGDKFDQLSTEDLHLLYIKDLSAKGMKKRYKGTETQEHLDRRDFELGVISSMGFVDYYLIVADFVNAALERGISVGPGRGSGAGSLIAYLMGITDIEPIEHGLLFERFLNPDRVSYPDFDIDFPDDRRQEMIDYVKDKYGEDHVAMIITFGTLAARSVIRAVGKVFNVPQARSNEIATMVPATPGITLKEAFEQSSALKAEYEKDAFTKHWLDMSMKLEGVPRNTSMHASGVIIADKPISDYVALTVSTKDDKEPMIQLDKDEAEEIGLLKFDFLGLRTQSVIANTEKMVREKALSLQEELETCKDQARIEEITTLLTNYRSDFSINEVSFDDNDTFELIQSGNTTGVFQLESDGMKNTAIQLIPESVGDITALISIFRPGPMEKIPEFIFNKANPEEIKHINPVLTKITEPTYGILIYQEQISAKR